MHSNYTGLCDAFSIAGRENSGMNYYEHHIGDYAAATAHLSLVEDAVYTRMIRRYYLQEGPLPADVAQVARLVGARDSQDLEAVEAVLAEFFTLAADGWHNKRCDEEIARFQTKIGKAKASANARWNPPSTPPECDRNATAMRTHSEGNALQSPYTSLHTPEKQKQKQPSSTPTAVDRPAWVPEEPWAGFEAMRRKSRYPMTQRAAKLILAELAKLREQGHDPAAVLDQSTRNGWRDVFPIRAQSRAGPAPVSRVMAGVQRLEEMKRGIENRRLATDRDTDGAPKALHAPTGQRAAG